ncbi:MAG TPA: peptidoglycan-binding protein, partial [Burkholderiaceae bacterium]
TRPNAEGSKFEVPSRFRITAAREDASVGDRLAPASVRDFAPFVPHSAPASMTGSVVSLYGDALSASTNQIVSINRGSQDGVERGHVLGLWHVGAVKQDASVQHGAMLKLPDRRIGSLFVFRVFNRVSYALVLDATEPTVPGDRVSAP